MLLLLVIIIIIVVDQSDLDLEPFYHVIVIFRPIMTLSLIIITSLVVTNALL